MTKKLSKLIALAAFAFLAAGFASQGLAARATEDFPVARLQSLDKATARTMTFDARVGSTVKFGKLFIKVQACRKTPPVELPEAAAFLQVWEDTAEKSSWVFSGWMFASSPGLSSMDHPIYDVWVLDCLGTAKTASKDASNEAKQTEPSAEELPAPEETPAAQD